MTDHSAIRVEVKLYAERKNKDGRITSFVMHPNETPQELTDAPVGKRFYMSLLDADRFDETEGREGSASEPSRSPQATPREAVGEPPTTEELDKDQFGKILHRRPVTLTQRAGMLCHEPAFHQYLMEEQMMPSSAIDREEIAATAVRLICGVKSRADILPGMPSGAAFEKLHSDYTIWRKHPDLVEP